MGKKKQNKKAKASAKKLKAFDSAITAGFVADDKVLTREDVLADAKRVMSQRGVSTVTIEKKAKLAEILTGDPEYGVAQLASIAELGVESLFLPFDVAKGDADGELVDKGWIFPQDGEIYRAMVSPWEPSWPPPYDKPECGKILKPVNEPALEICHKPRNHEDDHGRKAIVYEELTQPDPIIVGIDPKSEIGQAIHQIELLRAALSNILGALEDVAQKD